MPRSIITLTTDFGSTDGYVAQMKGVILGINPEAVLVDVTHSIPPQDILAGARQLDEVVDAFPPGTIHVGVVDPGVGTARSLIGVEAGGMRFVAPNNGMLSLVLQRWARSRAHRLSVPRFRRANISQTFHGRDILAPAAAHWSLGIDLAEFGPCLQPGEIVDIPLRKSRQAENAVHGEVVSIDHFGNLTTNISVNELPAADNNSLEILIGSKKLPGLHSTYASVPPGEPLALIGSSGKLEIAVNGGSAASVLSSAIGAAVTVVAR